MTAIERLYGPCAPVSAATPAMTTNGGGGHTLNALSEVVDTHELCLVHVRWSAPSSLQSSGGRLRAATASTIPRTPPSSRA